MTRESRILPLLLAAMALSACSTGIPKDALRLTPESMATRQLQTRFFETDDERKILQASAGVLQDLGFTIEESETELGVIVAAKDRDAKDPVQIAGVVFLAIFGVHSSFDDKQRIRVSLITRKSGENRVLTRITIQKMIWNAQGALWKTETVQDPEVYHGFFNRLSKSVFLEANNI